MMTSRWMRGFVVLLAAWTIAGTGVALAKSHHHYPDTVGGALNDCSNNNPLKGHYSLKVLQKALKEVKAESLQYTDCADALLAAIRQDTLGKPKPKVTTPNRTKVTRPVSTARVRPVQKAIGKRVHHLQSEGGGAVTLPTGQTVTPGVVTSHSSSFLSNLPTPLIVVLAALLAGVVAVGGRALQNLVRARRSR